MGLSAHKCIMGFVLTFDSAAWAGCSFWALASRTIARAASYSCDLGVLFVSVRARLDQACRAGECGT